MQLDVGMSPSANIMTFRPGLTHLTLDMQKNLLFFFLVTDIVDIQFQVASCYTFRARVFFSSLNLKLVTESDAY